MNKESAVVFDIEKFAVHDGPGIRTAVFLKGCPLHCIWCHNPESQAVSPEIFFLPEKCAGCGACAAACPNSCHRFPDGKHVFLREKCTACGKCAEICPAAALEKAGTEMSVDEVMEKVLEDRIFYQYSGGGMTVSGGEPLFHPDFTCRLLRSAKENGLHTCVETSGFAPLEIVKRTAPFVDLWLWDTKADSELHRKLTGVKDLIILRNLRWLGDNGAKYHLRCPVIPGANDTEAFFRKIAELSVRYPGCEKIELEPYHPLGENKCRHLDREPGYTGKFADKAVLEKQTAFLRSLTHVEITVPGN